MSKIRSKTTYLGNQAYRKETKNEFFQNYHRKKCMDFLEFSQFLPRHNFYKGCGLKTRQQQQQSVVDCFEEAVLA